MAEQTIKTELSALLGNTEGATIEQVLRNYRENGGTIGGGGNSKPLYFKYDPTHNPNHYLVKNPDDTLEDALTFSEVMDKIVYGNSLVAIGRGWKYDYFRLTATKGIDGGGSGDPKIWLIGLENGDTYHSESSNLESIAYFTFQEQARNFGSECCSLLYSEDDFGIVTLTTDYGVSVSDLISSLESGHDAVFTYLKEGTPRRYLNVIAFDVQEYEQGNSYTIKIAVRAHDPNYVEYTATGTKSDSSLVFSSTGS